MGLLIKLTDRGPVLYRQTRVGLGGKPFRIVKFRTMVVDADTQGLSVTRDADPRITWIGRILRKTKLDELPQLWNVLTGEMSFVGPRPEVPRYVEKYTADQRRVLSLKPGVTDLATLVYRNEERLLAGADDVEQFYLEQVVPRKIELNLAYAGHANVWEDTKIILRTLFPMLRLSSRAEKLGNLHSASAVSPVPKDEATQRLAQQNMMKAAVSSTGLLTAVCLSLWIVALWGFPVLWYQKTDPTQGLFWLAEQTRVEGWVYKDLPLDASAERVLVADRLVSGEFTRPDGRIVSVFSAKRYKEKANEIGLFVHTPDRCWSQSGWWIEPVAPDYVDLLIHGISIRLERRVFASNGAKELVYFGGLVGGQPLPYRLDHNLDLGIKNALRRTTKSDGTVYAKSGSTVRQRVWECFVSRRPMLGPKQFIRISTPIQGGDVEEADKLLQEGLSRWLLPADYGEELRQWGGGRLGESSGGRS